MFGQQTKPRRPEIAGLARRRHKAQRSGRTGNLAVQQGCAHISSSQSPFCGDSSLQKWQLHSVDRSAKVSDTRAITSCRSVCLQTVSNSDGDSSSFLPASDTGRSVSRTASAAAQPRSRTHRCYIESNSRHYLLTDTSAPPRIHSLL